MMRTKKTVSKLLIILLCLAITLSLCSCGSPRQAVVPTPTPSPEQTEGQELEADFIRFHKLTREERDISELLLGYLNPLIIFDFNCSWEDAKFVVKLEAYHNGVFSGTSYGSNPRDVDFNGNGRAAAFLDYDSLNIRAETTMGGSYHSAPFDNYGGFDANWLRVEKEIKAGDEVYIAVFAKQNPEHPLNTPSYYEANPDDIALYEEFYMVKCIFS